MADGNRSQREKKIDLHFTNVKESTASKSKVEHASDSQRTLKPKVTLERDYLSDITIGDMLLNLRDVVNVEEAHRERERESVCVCVCACEGGREKERGEVQHKTTNENQQNAVQKCSQTHLSCDGTEARPHGLH